MINVLQFGEGNFLRAFAEDYINTANEKGILDAQVTICQPRTNTRVINMLREQNCTYNIYKRGRMNGEVVDETVTINCVKECINTAAEYDRLCDAFISADVIISNTTEAGIVFDENDKMIDSPNVSFPAKITALLHKRYLTKGKPLLFLPVELIENNADELKKCILKYADLWELTDGFKGYVNSCSFCNTLVDRIVSGHSEGDSDKCSVNCEPYCSWIIQADDLCRKIFDITALDGVVFTDDIKPYRTRKVRILNGAHTMSVLAAYLCGFDIVRSMMQDKTFNRYILKGLSEVKTTLPLDRAELDSYANSVLDRFNNPFIDHRLLDIALNSVSKFKVRCLDTINDYFKITGEAPDILCFSLAALTEFYMLSGVANDSEDVLDDFSKMKSSDANTEINNVIAYFGITEELIADRVRRHYLNIKNEGIRQAVQEAVDGKII